MKKGIIIFFLLLTLLSLTACAAGPNLSVDTADKEGNVAGFWRGLWHGLITPITFIISLYSDNISIYEVHNSGGWYDFGFVLGLSATFGGSGGGAASARKS